MHTGELIIAAEGVSPYLKYYLGVVATTVAIMTPITIRHHIRAGAKQNKLSAKNTVQGQSNGGADRQLPPELATNPHLDHSDQVEADLHHESA